MKSHYPGCISDEECKCQDHDNETEQEENRVTCSHCEDSGTRIIAEKDGENFWNRCVPCECQSDPLIPVRASQWAHLNQCAKALEDMKSRYKNALNDMEGLIAERDEMKNALEYILGVGLTVKTQERAEKALGLSPKNSVLTQPDIAQHT
jgi:hypothetical protein